MTKTLQDRLRAGTIQHPRRWSGDTHADLGGSCDEEATDALMAEAAEAIATAETERDRLREAISERLMSVAREYEKAFDETFSDHHRAALAQTARELRRQAAALKETDT